MSKTIYGNINSFCSLGTVDGPGIRFVVFMQGCPLRCGCCHNPDTWEMNAGDKYLPQRVFERVVKYIDYFGEKGGITISGGEPLLQPQFAYQLFEICKNNGINTCLDTSGCILNDEIKLLLTKTDRVLLDIKYTSEEDYKKYVGCEYQKVLEFLDYLQSQNIKTTIRQVIIPTLNDNEDNILRLKDLIKTHSVVDSVELLPFKKLCKAKYENLKIPFRFENIDEPTTVCMQRLNKLLND